MASDKNIMQMMLHAVSGKSLLKATSATLALCLAISLPGFAVSAQAQESGHVKVQTAALKGHVSDAAGKPLAGAQIVIISKATQKQYKATAAADGSFTIAQIPDGAYSLTATKDGFKTFQIDTMPMMAGDVAKAEIKIEAGSSSEIQRGATASVTSSQGTSLAGKDAADIPENQRNFVNIAQLAAGANEAQTNTGSANAGATSRPGAQHDSSSVSVGGQPEWFNNAMIDGIDNNFRVQNTVSLRPVVDGIANIQIMSNAYSAAYGGAIGGVVNLVSKAGTKKYHGEAYEFFRNDALDASPYVFGAQVRKPEVRQNQFGGAVSGPFTHIGTFYADFENFRLIQSIAAQTFVVPTLYEQQNPGDFSDRASESFAKVSAIDSAALNYFKLFPLPNTGIAGDNRFVAVHSGSNFSYMGDGRIDLNLTKKDQFFTRFSVNNTNTVLPPTFPAVQIAGMTVQPTASREGPGSIVAWNGVMSLTHTFTPHVLFNIKGGYAVHQEHQLAQNMGKNVNAAFGMAGVNLDSNTTGLALLSVNSGAQVGNSGWRRPMAQDENVFDYKGELEWIKGKHEIYIGGGLLRRKWLDFAGDYALGMWSFKDYSTLLTGAFKNVQRSMYIVNPLHYAYWASNEYVEDHWKLTPKMTVTYGLRYDIFAQPTEQRNRLSAFDNTTGKILVAGKNGVSDAAGIQTDYSHIQPRIGINYEFNDRLTIHSAIGMTAGSPSHMGQFAMQPFTYSYGSYNSGNAPEGYKTLSAGLPTPTTPDASNPTGTITYSREKNYHMMSVTQWNIAVDTKLSRFDKALFVYAGSHAEHVTQVVPDINVPTPSANGVVNSARPYYAIDPGLTTISQDQGHAIANYNAFQATYSHSTQYGVSGSFNYTLAHSLDDARTFTDQAGFGIVPSKIRALDYGNSLQDVRHHLSTLVSYKLPFGEHAHGVEALAKAGWQTNITFVWGTGMPFTVLNSSNMTGTSNGGATDRPNVSGTVKKSNPGIAQFFNTSAFSAQTLGTLGTEGRNQYFGPTSRHVDFSLFKNFTIWQSVKGQFRTECFNITNTSNFAAPEITLGKSNFGTLDATTRGYTPRELQFVMKFTY